ncbi:hypothetical protein [Paracoccus zhejiangensis]|uniref:Uncharacterized protein n=1 Tax=Paracoccus zhejiangensis TaxID=1077935 RepID=A0A2H5EVM6_9RHOB|nr:hypothetical protein [Paracoccus zhejiangensis]AUH63358.1 hypothetical protein CX676_03625 [Paracoccus zhejiangensis]
MRAQDRAGLTGYFGTAKKYTFDQLENGNIWNLVHDRGERRTSGGIRSVSRPFTTKLSLSRRKLETTFGLFLVAVCLNFLWELLAG